MIKELETLVEDGILASYQLLDVDDYGEEVDSQFCTSQKLILKFLNGKILELRTICSGCLENTGFYFNLIPTERENETR